MRIRRVCGALLALTLSLPLAAATYNVRPSGDTTGATDTAAIQMYLDICAISDPGCTVQLGAGQFWLKQIAVEDFHGAVRGMGVGETMVSPIPDLPVIPKVTYNKEDPYPTRAGGANPWPILLTFIGGEISISDISFKVPDATPTTGWLEEWAGEVDQRIHLWAVVFVTGEWAISSIERIEVEGVPTPDYPGYSVEAAVEIAAPVGPWLGGRHSVISSRMKSVVYGVAAWRLEDARITIGGNPSSGNIAEDCTSCVAAISANRSGIEISHNEISPANSVGIGLWSLEADQLSDYVALHNTIHYPADKWARGFCVVDHGRRSGAETAALKATVLYNRLEMAGRPQQGIRVDSADGALVAGNIASGSAGWPLMAVGASNAMFINNDLTNFTKEPKIQVQNSTDSLVVAAAESNVQETGGSGNRIVEFTTVRNQAPAAVITPEIQTVVTREIQLDGSQSYDPEGDVLTFAWKNTGRPAALMKSDTARPVVQFGSGQGDYTFELTVTDDTGLVGRATSVVTFVGR